MGRGQCQRCERGWIWHANFQLDRGGGIPILVTDVDADGDNERIWGRGHDYGLYLLEHRRIP